MCDGQRSEAKGEEERGDLHDWWREGTVGVVTRTWLISLAFKHPRFVVIHVACEHRSAREKIRLLTDYFSS